MLDANKEATFSYKNYLGEDTVGTFPVPQVTVGGGNILVHYYLVNDQGQPINENGTVVASPALAKQVKTAAYHEENGSTGLSYNIRYTVFSEDVANYNYFGKYILNNGDLTAGNSVEVTLTAANSNQHVWFAYTQSFYVVHVQMDENGQGKQVGETETYPFTGSFDLTAHVSQGYLYGGAFNSEACTEAYLFAEGETGLSFAPKAGETYYIWEVPNAYLKPMALSCWEHNTEGQLDVIGFYMVSAIDRALYKEAGFYVNGTRTTANQMTYEAIDENRTTVANLPEGQSVAFKGITINLKQEGQSDSYTAASVVTGDKYGYMLCYGLDKDTYWSEAGKAVSYYPYWVTLDGVEVTNSVTRTGTYQGTPVSVMASGMGMPSIGIYSHELFHFYDVDNIIRVGSAGAISPQLKVRDVVFGQGSCTDSNYAHQFGLGGTFAPIADFTLLETAVTVARKLGIEPHVGSLLSSDVFYNKAGNTLDWGKMGVLAVEMESAALYCNAAEAGKRALAICTISDSLITGEELPAADRQTTFTQMMEIALGVAVEMAKK